MGKVAGGRIYWERATVSLAGNRSPDSTLSKVTSSHLPPKGWQAGGDRYLKLCGRPVHHVSGILQHAFDVLTFRVFHSVALPL